MLIKSVDVLKRVHSWSALDGVRGLFSNRRFRIELDYGKLKIFLEFKSNIKIKLKIIKRSSFIFTFLINYSCD